MAGNGLGETFDSVVKYFKNLTTDLILAWVVLVIGIVLLIVALTL